MNGTANRTAGLGTDDAGGPANPRDGLLDAYTQRLVQATYEVEESCLKLEQAKTRFLTAVDALREARAARQGQRRG